MQTTKKFLVLVIALALITGTIFAAGEVQAVSVDEDVEIQDEYNFVMIPILVQEWFDIVYESAQDTADMYGELLGTEINIDYQAPEEADLSVQNEYIQRAIAMDPDGIAVDLIDAGSSEPFLQEVLDHDIPLKLYVSAPPEGIEEIDPNFSFVGADFYEQGEMASRKLVELLDEEGEVAVLHGVPENTAHYRRYDAHMDVFDEYEDIEVVAEAFTYDDVETAQEEASRILSANPDLDGFIPVDAAGPIGIGNSLLEAGMEDQVEVVGIDDLPRTQELVEMGVIEESYVLPPRIIGQWITTSLLARNLGQEMPTEVDVGYRVLTEETLEDPDFEGF